MSRRPGKYTGDIGQRFDRSLERLMDELDIAVKTGKCPMCESELVVDEKIGYILCPACMWACGVVTAE